MHEFAIYTPFNDRGVGVGGTEEGGPYIRRVEGDREGMRQKTKRSAGREGGGGERGKREKGRREGVMYLLMNVHAERRRRKRLLLL